MKLTREKKGSSFFEAFSDLIFATMAIFVLLLVIVLSQVNPKVPRTQYITGGSQPTFSLISHANVRGEPSVVFFPTDVANMLNMARSVGNNDPLLRLSEIAASEDGIVAISVERYVGMASGFSPEFAAGIRSQGEGTIEASLLINRVSRGGDGGSMTGLQAKDLLFNEDTLRVLGDQNNDTGIGVASAFRDEYDEALRWLQTHEEGNFHSWILKTRTPTRERANAEESNFALVIAEPIREGVIRIGSTELTTREFRGFLKSIQPGFDFALKFIDENGMTIDPPNRLIESVLTPVGYNARF